ncbi:hypothetical protein EK21DRAFT_81050 [Setomelanomma holmii]|uniref:WD40 repeat-like protein n=1 Tax=Setomelanomma holmii TaxID=210430 RepID=A0A9P4GVD7_9PLEO|nr:hypothetical protein EK21DRAFT_81050 [Setomelanomma holmii]
MSGSGLKVRCLASTRVVQTTWKKQESRDEDEKGEEDVSDEAHQDDDTIEDLQAEERDDESRETSAYEEIEAQGTPTAQSPSSPSSASDSNSSTTSSSSDASTSSFTHNPDIHHTSCIQEAQLSPDGTCVFTSSYDRSFTVYPISSTIFSSPRPQPLAPYAKFTSPDPIWSFASNPLFDINDASTTHVLISRRDRYITLHNALWAINSPNPSSVPTGMVDIQTPLASYKLISPLTEALTAPFSLSYSHSGTHFFAGLKNSIALFDVEYTDEPTTNIPTIPSARNVRKGGGVGFKGVISSLALSPSTTFHREGILAAGSRTRYVGLYDAASSDKISTFALPVRQIRNANEEGDDLMGGGASRLKWSSCGKYLYIAERLSDVLHIYDVRNFSFALAHCAGRKAKTNQKLGFDVWSAASSVYSPDVVSHEVWAGGTDGCVRVWRDAYLKEGRVDADEVVQVGEGEMPVVGTMVHASGGLAVAACGQIEVGENGEGRSRGGGSMPGFRERGSLDILGLS